MRNDSAEILFQSLLQEALVSRSRQGRLPNREKSFITQVTTVQLRKPRSFSPRSVLLTSRHITARLYWDELLLTPKIMRFKTRSTTAQMYFLYYVSEM